jgi:prophage antirepressor-like protein
MIPNKTRERQLIPLTFQDRAVRTVLIDGAPWFVAKDVCDILEIQNSRDTLAKLLPESEKGVDSIYTLGGNQSVQIVNEPGLYRLIFQSRKPEAEQFKTWVFNNVLPQIRQTGFFIPISSNTDERLLTLTIARYFESRRPNKQAGIKIGECLVLLKNLKSHGEFIPCLSEMGISIRNAEHYMKLYRKSTGQELFIQDGLKKRSIKRLTVYLNRLFIGRQLPLINFRNELPLNAM